MTKKETEFKHYISKALAAVAKMIDVAGIPEHPIIAAGDPLLSTETFFLVVWKRTPNNVRLEKIGDISVLTFPYGRREKPIEA